MKNNMWKKGIVLGTIMLFIGAGVVPSISGNIRESNIVKDVKSNKQGTLAESIVVTLNAEEYEINNLDTGYSEINMMGFGSILSPGEPMLPSKTFFVGLPPGGEVVSVDLISENNEEIAGSYHIRPAPPFFGDENTEANLEVNTDLYTSTGPYPSNVYEYMGMSQMRKYYLAMISFAPFSYYPSDDKLVLHKSITLRVRYKIVEKVSNEMLGDTGMDDVAPEIIVNYPSIAHLYRPSSISTNLQTHDYVIITTSSLYSYLSIFKAWKQSIGYFVKIVNLSWITTNYPASDTQKSIRDFLVANYLSWGIKYVLIVGSHSSIPMRICYPDPTNHNNDGTHDIPTDYYYADLTGNWDSDGDGFYGERGQDSYDFTPEVHVGRIPIDASSTVTSICAKILNFEQTSNTGWKKNAMLLGCVLNYYNEDYSGYSRTDGAELMEQCMNNLLVGYACTTMYEKSGLAPCSYSCTFPLTNANVKAQWGSITGWGIVNWHGHGSSTSVGRKVWSSDDGDSVPESFEMTWPTMIQNTDNAVLNDNKPPIVFAVSCNTAYPETANNLGAALLTKGASAYIGSTRISWGSVGWTQPSHGGSASMSYDFIDRIANVGQDCGNALYNAKLYYWANFNWGSWAWRVNANMYDFNLYGDPSMGMAQVAPNNPPYAPSNPNPVDGATDVFVDVDLSWTGGDPDPGNTVTYDIYFGTSSPPPKVVDNHSATTYDPGSLNYNTMYYWMVVAWDNHGASNSSDEWEFTTEIFVTVPDLDCTGDLSWTDVESGATVEGSFTVENIGDPTSELDWEIESYPDWGTWTFDPESGTGLEEGDTVTIDVEVVAPDEQDETFTGEVVLVNSNDPDDTCTIDVSLATPVSQQVINPLLQMILERFPNAFPILRYLLGL